MSEYLFPIPGSVLRGLLDRKAQAGEQFSEKEATADVMLAMDRGNIKPLRYLAKRWGWSRNTVHRRMDELKEMAASWRNFEYNKPTDDLGQDGTRLGQRGTKSGENDSVSAEDGTRLGQDGTRLGQYRTDTYTNIQSTPPISPPSGKTLVERYGPELWMHPAVVAYLRTFPSLEQRMRQQHREQIAIKIGEDPADLETWQGILDKWAGTVGWRPEKIHNLVDAFQREKHNGAAEAHVHPDGRRNGTVHRTKAGTGPTMPGGVRRREKTPVRNPTRPGEYSVDEYLRESGWTEDDIRLLGDGAEIGRGLPAHPEGDDA